MLAFLFLSSTPAYADSDDDAYYAQEVYHEQQAQLQRQDDQYRPPEWVTGNEVYRSHSLDRTYDDQRQEQKEIRDDERRENNEPWPGRYTR